jgi:hypothetical protein
MLLGLQEPLHTKAEWEKIRDAACNLICYNRGYKNRKEVFMVFFAGAKPLEKSAWIQGHRIRLKSCHK